MGSRVNPLLARTGIPALNAVTRIKELASEGHWHDAFHHFNEAKRAGVEIIDPSVINSIVKASSRISVNHGKSIHACLLKQGLDLFSSVGNSIMDFYVKCGDLGSALGVLRSMLRRDSVSWNVIVHGFLDQGNLERGLSWFRRAWTNGFEPNVATLVLVIRACGVLGLIRELFGVHGYAIKSGLLGTTSVQNCLLGLYGDVDIELACELFDEMPDRDVIPWSVMIAGYVRNEEEDLGLLMFVQMVSEAKVEPDEVALVSVLKACASTESLIWGKMAHCFALCKSLDSDLFVGNTLIDMYFKCRDVNSAVRVFSEMPHWNLVSWNSLMSGYVLNEKYTEALFMFHSIGKGRIEADEVTLVNVLQVSKYYVESYWCKSVHGLTLRKAYESNGFLLNSLVDAYAKCGFVDLALEVFTRMEIKDRVAWSTIISGLTHNWDPDRAIAIFNEMISMREKPNAVTIINLLEACSLSTELGRAKSAHGIAIRRGLALEDVTVGTAIVDTYSKCGAIESACKAFYQIPQKNILSWSAMVAGYGMNGLPREALTLLAEMERQSIKPNGVTALSVLSACSHGGLVQEGLDFFKLMVHKYGLRQEPEHYACVVDMLCRAGKLDTAMNLMNNMPKGLEASTSAWGALLSASRSFSSKEIKKDVVSKVLELEPSHSANYMLAASMYAAGGLWTDSARMRKLVKEIGIRVIAGYSFVDVNNKSCRFVAGDESHPQIHEVRTAVEQLHGCMKIDRSDFMAP